MSAIFFMKLVGALAFLAGHSFANFWQPAKPVTTPGPQYYKKFEAVPAPKETATKLVTNFLRIPLGRVGKRQAPRIEDIVVVMDGSGSIGSCEFDKGKKALKNMIDLATTNTKYAAVTFGSSASVNFNFLTNPPAGSRILQISYPNGGSTNTQAGLAEAKKLVENPSSGRRVYSIKMVFLVTDGHSNIQTSLTIPNADALKSIGVKIFVVAVGRYINGIDEMVKVASYPPENHLFRVNSLTDFYKVVRLAYKQVAPDKYKILAGHYEPPC